MTPNHEAGGWGALVLGAGDELYLVGLQNVGT